MVDRPSEDGDPPMPQGWPSPESASQRGRGTPTRETLRETLPERPAAATPASGEFPPEGETEYERSVIRIPFYLKGRDQEESTRSVDVMAFDAYMRLLREPPIRNGLGLRQFEFYIDAWELDNTYSRGLEADITFTLSDTIQPKSLCVALQRESDYPALITYNAIYDVYMGAERIIENQPGVAMATPVWEIPPRNITVAFEKPFESDLFAFSAGTCEGMRTISGEEFEAGRIQAAQKRRQGQ